MEVGKANLETIIYLFHRPKSLILTRVSSLSIEINRNSSLSSISPTNTRRGSDIYLLSFAVFFKSLDLITESSTSASSQLCSLKNRAVNLTQMLWMKDKRKFEPEKKAWGENKQANKPKQPKKAKQNKPTNKQNTNTHTHPQTKKPTLNWFWPWNILKSSRARTFESTH